LVLKVDYQSVSDNSPNADICLKCGVCCVANDFFCHAQFDAQFNPKNTFVYNCLEPENPAENPNIWLCVSCHKCEEACPYDVSPVEFIEATKSESFEKGYAHPGIVGEVEQIISTGFAFPITSSTIRTRERMGLDTIQSAPEEIKVIARKTGLLDKLEALKEEN
jgi:heterodisulfide reductase subunit C